LALLAETSLLAIIPHSALTTPEFGKDGADAVEGSAVFSQFEDFKGSEKLHGISRRIAQRFHYAGTDEHGDVVFAPV